MQWTDWVRDSKWAMTDDGYPLLEELRFDENDGRWHLTTDGEFLAEFFADGEFQAMRIASAICETYEEDYR